MTARHPKCCISTGIDGALTAGWGELSDLGYWQHECLECALGANSSEVRRLQALTDSLCAAVQVLRKLLAFRHGCPTEALYGDDGELACGACKVDFRRIDPTELDQRWVMEGLRKLAEGER